MMLVTIDSIPGKEYEVLGIAKGTIVQSKNFGRDFMAAVKTLVGGEIAGSRYAGRRRNCCLRNSCIISLIFCCHHLYRSKTSVRPFSTSGCSLRTL